MDQRTKSMPGDWLECYGTVHDFRWRGATVELVVWEGRRVERVTRICQRCPKVRIDYIHRRTLELLGRTYTKVDGYDAKPGEGRIPRPDITRELMRRAREDDWS